MFRRNDIDLLDIVGAICFVIALVIILASCNFNPESLLPPGSVPGQPTGSTEHDGDAFIATTPPDILATSPEPSTPETAYISGEWRCRTQPDLLSNTDVFLHDGEAVTILERKENDWIFIQAGKQSCYIKEKAIE